MVVGNTIFTVWDSLFFLKRKGKVSVHSLVERGNTSCPFQRKKKRCPSINVKLSEHFFKQKNQGYKKCAI
jgi:hypothetical protein